MKLALLLVLHFLSLGFSFLSIWRAIHNGQRKSHLIVVSVNEIDSFPSLFEGDVVEYMIDSNGPFLGAIALSGSGSVTRINQLCKFSRLFIF